MRQRVTRMDVLQRKVDITKLKIGEEFVMEDGREGTVCEARGGRVYAVIDPPEGQDIAECGWYGHGLIVLRLGTISPNYQKARRGKVRCATSA